MSEKKIAVIGFVIGVAFVLVLFFASGIPLERSFDLMMAVLLTPIIGVAGMFIALFIHALNE